MSDPEVLTMSDTESDPKEERFIGLGMSVMPRLPVVVYTYRGEDIRIISARKATESERKEYEAQL